MTKESKRNLNRVTKNNPHTSRGVDNLNPLNTYNKEFNAANSSAVLDIDIKEMPNPCTINPPIADSWCRTEWAGDWVGGGQGQGTCFAANCCGGELVNWHIVEGSLEGTSDYVIDYRNVYYEVPIENPEMGYYQKLLEQAERNLMTIRWEMENRLNYVYPMQLQALIDIYEYYEEQGHGGSAYFIENLRVPQHTDSVMPLSDWYLRVYGEGIDYLGGSWIQFWNFCFLTGYPTDLIAKNLPTYTNPIAPEEKHLGGWYRGDLMWSEEHYENGFYPFYEQTKYCVPFVRSPYEYMGQVDFDVPRSIEELRALKEYWDLYVFDYSWFEQQVIDAQALIEAAPPPPEVEPVIVSYVITQNGIVVPEDGCYLVTYQGRGWGVSYFNDGVTQAAYILHNSNRVASGENPSTGRIILLGPHIYYWPPITNLVAYVEARAGDTISCLANASGFHKCYPWVAGTFLKGDYLPLSSTLSVKLVASAEGVRAPTPRDLFVDEYQEEGIIVDSAAATSVWQQPASAQVVIV